MRHIVIHMPASPLCELELCRWIGEAAPGDLLEYHRGFLAIDIDTISRTVAEQKALRLLARRAMWAAEAGFVHLAQRRVGPGVFAYLAVKRPRGFVAPPSIDPSGGSIGDLRTVGPRAVAG